MSDDGVGYKRPPKSGQFRKGQSGNSRGRPKKTVTPLAEAIGRALRSPTRFRDGTIARVAPAIEVLLRATVRRAAEGDVQAADAVLVARSEVLRHVDSGTERIVVHNRLPRLCPQDR